VAEECIIGIFYFTIYSALVWYTVACLRDMPRSAMTDHCEQGCRPPMLMPHYFNNFGWRCGECGTKWKIAIDLTKPRREYRQWVPK